MVEMSYVLAKRKEIGMRIHNRRTELGLFQKDLADRVGTSQRNISDIEKGKINFSIDKIISIYKVLKLDI